MSEVGISISDYVAEVEIQRPPHNFFDADLINELADVFESCDGNDDVRAIVLCSSGKNFCAGNDFSSTVTSVPNAATTVVGTSVVKQKVRIFAY